MRLISAGSGVQVPAPAPTFFTRPARMPTRVDRPLAGASLQALEGHSVAAAVSGGADSVALALWLRANHDRVPRRVTFAGIVHVNHKLRGAESDRDEVFCRALADRLGVPIEVIEAP